ncbi:CTAG/PCC1 family protein [Candidatus Bathyarchaeota archaeon]|nr:CTAG/PCC1 family protein [Candidatus Bathyarchaeota archaeon]
MDNHDAPVTATVSIELNPMLLEAVTTALIPESETPSSDRSETSITVEGNLLIIQTRASDTTALRASLNSYLRWVQGIQSIVESIT